jgi:hypothetical protein
LVGQAPVDDNAVLHEQTSQGKNRQNQNVENKNFLTCENNGLFIIDWMIVDKCLKGK